jgi:uncharacterized membrane protein YfcA
MRRARRACSAARVAGARAGGADAGGAAVSDPAAGAGLGIEVWGALTAIAVATSAVSGVLGLAGGMMLLAALLQWLDPVVAIPVHGAVQLVSNASRAWFQRAHVRWDAVWRFAWPLLPAGALGLALLRAIPPDAGRLAIGAFVLVATWAPDWLRGRGAAAARGDARRALPVAGALVGFLSTTIGATGPLLAPFVLALGLAPPATIGTMAACQIFQHGAKLALFGAAGFDFGRYALPALALCAAAVAGSALGARLLDRLPERAFRTAVKAVLTLLALQLIGDALFGDVARLVSLVSLLDGVRK